MIKRRPVLITPWSIWIKPGLRVRYIDIRFYKEHGKDDQGRSIIQIVDEFDREYWTRLIGKRLSLFRFFAR